MRTAAHNQHPSNHNPTHSQHSGTTTTQKTFVDFVYWRSAAHEVLHNRLWFELCCPAHWAHAMRCTQHAAAPDGYSHGVEAYLSYTLLLLGRMAGMQAAVAQAAGLEGG